MFNSRVSIKKKREQASKYAQKKNEKTGKITRGLACNL
jgi:hypothetical protein